MNVGIVISAPLNRSVDRLPARLGLADGATVDDALESLTGWLPGDARLPGSCLLFLSGAPLGTIKTHRNQELRDGDELELIAPAAGG
jgi:molybdopterin converting factor small subunit